MSDYIEKHKAVNLLTALENELQQFKPFKGFENAMYRKLCETEIAIGKLPAANVIPRPRWIPADEELPPEGKHVLCWYEYFRYGGYNRMYQTFGIGYRFCEYWGGEVAQGRDAKVLAWMPLPEPPEMDGGTDNG